MCYEIIFAPQAEEDLLALRAKERSEVLDAIETHLRYEPEKTSKSRIKRLEALDWPQYRLRIGDIRAFYDVSYVHEGGMVEALLDLVKDFHLLVRLKVFNTRQMNQAVFAFRRYEDA